MFAGRTAHRLIKGGTGPPHAFAQAIIDVAAAWHDAAAANPVTHTMVDSLQQHWRIASPLIVTGS